jgi:hypothetical protein
MTARRAPVERSATLDPRLTSRITGVPSAARRFFRAQRPRKENRMRRFLIVGNQTLASDELRAAVRERVADGPCRFHIVVPATPPGDHFSWSEGEAITVARRRLDEALAWMDEEGATCTGTVGDGSPALAVADVLERESFDEIIVSTLPSGLSRWIHQDLPHRLARRTGLPVAHVVAAVPATEVRR